MNKFKSILLNIGLRLKNLALSLDQFIYVIITLGAGNPDETCSSAAWRMECDGKFFGFFRPIIDCIFFWDDNHCKESYENEIFNVVQLRERQQMNNLNKLAGDGDETGNGSPPDKPVNPPVNP